MYVSFGLRFGLGVTVATTLSVVVADADFYISSQRTAFRAGVDLVSLAVTATDARQRYVADLDRNEFMIAENGVPQELAFFAKAGIPLTLALLIDTSASMQHKLSVAQEAATGFVRHITPADLAMVIDFDSTVQTPQSLTGDRAALENAIRRTTPGGSTVLYNAVYIALNELGKLPRAEATMPRRRAIIVLSDGDDTSSLVSFDEVLDLASRSDTAIYTIGLGPSDPITGGRSRAQSRLIRLARQTGGRAFFPRNIRDLAGVYGDIREELSNQYALAYESNSLSRDGQWRRVSVRVNRPGIMVRTRPGYFAPRDRTRQ
jgi:Ca-activated chloride channel family protein